MAITYFEQQARSRELIEAVRACNIAKVKTALENGADIHIGKDRCLIDAARYGNAEITQMLLDAGANPYAQMGVRMDMVFTGTSSEPKPKALIYAEDRGDAEIVKVFQDYLAENKNTPKTATKHELSHKQHEFADPH